MFLGSGDNGSYNGIKTSSAYVVWDTIGRKKNGLGKIGWRIENLWQTGLESVLYIQRECWDDDGGINAGDGNGGTEIIGSGAWMSCRTILL